MAITILLSLSLIFLAYIFVFAEQNQKLNWAMFYSSLYLTISLPIVNYLLVNYRFWEFTQPNSINFPLTLFYLWVVIWAILPVYFLKGRYIAIVLVLVFWVDFLFMPLLVKLGLLKLNDNWLWGEVIIICLCFLPSYLWASSSYFNKNLIFRSLMQVLVVSGIFLVGLPFLLFINGLAPEFTFNSNPFLIQVFIILVFPAMVAVYDLWKKGKGTSFPYDRTLKLVRSGVYAYCRNPIQVSFTLLFFPLSIIYQSPYLLLGSVFSIAYVYGVSNYNEYPDMKERFGEEWNTYFEHTPAWRLLWVAKNIPKGTVYFDMECDICSKIQLWFLNAKSYNLEIKSRKEFKNGDIEQVTFTDYLGIEYKGIKAIACAFEHLNLAYASLGWFMKTPVISHLLQLILDSMDINKSEVCHIDLTKENQ